VITEEKSVRAEPIGMVGAGAMGRAFSKSLMTAGYDVVVFDVSPAALQTAASDGARVAGSAKEVAEEAGIIITVLPYAEDVGRALLGEGGIVEAAGEHTIVIEASTIDPGAVRDLAGRFERSGGRLLDAGISASPPMAVQGKGALFVSGARDIVDRCEPVLAVLFREGRVVFVGDLGSAKVMKLINNMVGAVQMVAISEAFDVGLRAGIDPRVVFEGLGLGMAACWALRVRPPHPGLVANSPADLDFAPDFPLDYMVKDLDYFRSTAHVLGSAPLVAGVVRELYGYAARAGIGRKDFAAISLLVQGSLENVAPQGTPQARASELR
jgi:2-hydroxy-3-oxopropionate reductase